MRIKKNLMKKFGDEYKKDFSIIEKYDISVLEILYNQYVDKKEGRCMSNSVCTTSPKEVDNKYVMNFMDYVILKREKEEK